MNDAKAPEKSLYSFYVTLVSFVIFQMLLYGIWSISNTAPAIAIPNRYFFPGPSKLETNHSPISNAGENQTINPGNIVTLDGSKSKDPDNDPIQYTWVQIAGPNVTLNGALSPIATFTAPSKISADTTLVFRLIVKDDKNATGIDGVQVIDRYILPPNQPPISNTGQDRTVN